MIPIAFVDVFYDADNLPSLDLANVCLTFFAGNVRYDVPLTSNVHLDLRHQLRPRLLRHGPPQLLLPRRRHRGVPGRRNRRDHQFGRWSRFSRIHI